NGLGTPHGAVIFALADIAFACACNASETSYIGLQADIRYLNRASGDELIAHAELVGASGRLAHYQISVNDALGNRVALLSASAYRLPQPGARTAGSTAQAAACSPAAGSPRAINRVLRCYCCTTRWAASSSGATSPNAWHKPQAAR